MVVPQGHPPAHPERHLKSAFSRPAAPMSAPDSFEPLNPPLPRKGSPLRPLPKLIFASRWLQLPLYLGLIVAQAVYVLHFLKELWHLVEAAFGNQHALELLVTS